MKKIFFTLFIFLMLACSANAASYTIQETHYISEQLTITKYKTQSGQAYKTSKKVHPRTNKKRYATSLELYKNQI